MQRYTSKQYRRLGIRRTDSPKDPAVRRNYPPGIHGSKGAPRKTEYGLQLAEKQKAKVVYGLAERQFRNYFEKAIQKKGDTGGNLKQLLETRLDNVIYRLGFGKTRAHARQLVNHGFFKVNGRKVDIPSFIVKIKDEICINPVKMKSKVFVELEKLPETHQNPSWLLYNPQQQTAKVVSMPAAEEMEQTFNPRLIVEFFSR